ncbi:MAG: VWA domain-containing protein, partial [Gammaproteobacteria bacterium]|nr:VWA domain-containing protein [Gammaproteobacteria bacterium]
SLLALLPATLAWVALVTAAARPVWIGDSVALPVAGRDLMMAVDLSGSMQEQDFILDGQVVDRLVATKAVAGEFIRSRKGDRIGLVLFGDQAYLQAPLTFDRQTVLQLLNESAIGLAGERTAIGDAIGLGLKRLQDSPEKNRVMILMTDGANTAGSVSPLEAADMAASAGLKIYTVGIGSESDQMRSVFGFQLMNPAADLDERTLKAIAEKTGGLYFRARDTEEFQHIYAELDRLEPVEKEAEHWRPQTELFRWPLLAAFVLTLLAAVLRIEPEK